MILFFLHCGILEHFFSFFHDISLNYSVGEWEIYMTESSSLIFYGMERLLSYIPPEKMPALNIPGI